MPCIQLFGSTAFSIFLISTIPPSTESFSARQLRTAYGRETLCNCIQYITAALKKQARFGVRKICYADFPHVRSFFPYFQNPAAIPTKVTASPTPRHSGSIRPFAIISAPSVYPKGVIYFRNPAFSVRFATIFRK